MTVAPAQRRASEPLSGETIAPGPWLDWLVTSEQLFVVFQPIVDLLTGDVTGYEVLGRLNPEAPGAALYGRRGPAGLFELAYEHGRLLTLDRRLRAIALEAIAARHADASCSFFLNVDPRIIEDPAFSVGFTRSELERHGLEAARIVFELTESGAVLSTGRLESLVRHYEDQGFRIALDDVGSGYASLTALLRLRPHFLKLDKELVQGIERDALRQNLVHALGEFGRRSDIRVIAEGVETEETLAALVEAGIGLGQGYLFGRPAPSATPPDEATRRGLRRVQRRAERADVSCARAPRARAARRARLRRR